MSYYNADRLPELVNKSAIEILLPCQLQKVGDIADRLYWDNSKGKYIIEKNINSTTIKLSDKNLELHGVNNEERATIGVRQYPMPNPSDILRTSGINGYYLVCDTFKNIIDKDNDEEYISVCYPTLNYTMIKFRIAKSRLDTPDLEGVNKWYSENPMNIYYITASPQLIETNITKKIQLTTYAEKTYISTASENGVNPTLKITVDKIEEVSQEAVDNVLSTPTSTNIALARIFVNLLPESLYKDQLQAKLNEIFSEDMVLEKQSATANLDVYIQSENILMMSLNTNTVTFEDYSGVEELELQNAINISINSSLPYSLNAYVVGNITNKDKNKTLDLDVLNIKDSSEATYKQFDSINSKLVLLDNVEKGNNTSHNIDLKLSGNKAHDADVYKTTIKFEAEQK